MTYTISATDKTLKSLITKEMKKHGTNCSLNHIDVSHVTDMNSLFYGSDFNGDISLWNTSKVMNMNRIFYNSKFNGDISQWDTSKVTNMSWMFRESKFNGDISKWNTSNVTDMYGMFYESQFTGDLRPWNKTETQLKEAFVDSYKEYLEKRRIILEHAQLVEQFQANGITKKTRSL